MEKNNIKKLRQEHKISQTQLAKRLNTSQANVSSWEKNKWQPDIETLKKMAQIFNCSIDELLDYEPPTKKEPAVIQVQEEEQKWMQLHELINKLDDKQSKVAEIYLKTLLGEEETLTPIKFETREKK